MGDARKLAFEYVEAMNVGNIYRMTIVKAQAENIGIWESVNEEALKLRAHTGDILAIWELRGIKDRKIC